VKREEGSPREIVIWQSNNEARRKKKSKENYFKEGVSSPAGSWD